VKNIPERHGQTNTVTDGQTTYCFTAQGRPKAPPATQNASQKSLGTKIRKLGGTNLPFCFKGKLMCWKF